MIPLKVHSGSGATVGAVLRSLMLIALTLALVGCMSRPAPQAQPSVAELKAQIAALETLNRLQLTPDQLSKLAQLLQPVAQQRELAQNKRRELEQRMIPLLVRKREHLLRDEPVPTELMNELNQLEREVADAEALDPERLSALGQQLRGLMTPEQKAIVGGGLEARIQAGEALDGFRAFPADEFENQVRDYAANLAAESGIMGPEDVEALLREARSLSDLEYKASRDKLVTQLQPLFTPKETVADRLLVEFFTRPAVIDLVLQKAAAGSRQTPGQG